ncbi:adenosylcobinamide-GDP ribazoletransferase [Chryseobacterium sp. POL2]|uniref:adenosylcobinamide-GDP ribazoletransferase n=1 Tax=Chryseobacterium sp. POL2 TaxID=2713414 RepID=UPI0013E192DF|nr:adenosylcobinamide-GDP ribazoletransferase [Chryseobacterium sp. POL2]QIG88388.1 adenosylcobinamide-GDP ribazoletransferase [Chryseobacterium sp. POL2]
MKREFHIFLTALMFFTRIPIPSFKNYDEKLLNQCTRYFSLVGILVGAISFLAFALSSFLFPTEIAVIWSLVAGVLVTGAFHEDGFADVFDGFGGGWTKTKILDIMKDSRLGTYGTVALIFLFGLKVYTLTTFINFAKGDWLFIFAGFICYHALARTAGITLSFLIPYSREDATSKSKPLAKSFTWKEVFGAYIFGCFSLIFLVTFSLHFLATIPVLMLLIIYSKYYFNKWIDGFTGDCLGAVEQFAEIFILLTIIAVCQYI